MKRIPLILVLVILIGCTQTKQLAPLPKVQDTNRAAHIHVMRVPRFYMDGVVYLIHLDEDLVFQIKPSYRTTFLVDPGIHVVTLVKQVYAGMQSQRVKLNCVPGGEYYLIISPRGMKEISKEQAAPYLEKYKHVPLEYEED
jgi:hypothetical protein